MKANIINQTQKTKVVHSYGEKDAKGRAVLRCHFEKASAAIVVFGDLGNTRKVPES